MMRERGARPPLKSTGARLYSAALFLCPPAFRREFSSEMARDVDDAAEETRRAGRLRASARLWTVIAADLARTVVVQWLRTGVPVPLLCSIAAAIAATGVAGHVVLRAPVDIAPGYDRDVMTLILLTGVVLTVIVATILFTFWFSRPVGRGRR